MEKTIILGRNLLNCQQFEENYWITMAFSLSFLKKRGVYFINLCTPRKTNIESKNWCFSSDLVGVNDIRWVLWFSRYMSFFFEQNSANQLLYETKETKQNLTKNSSDYSEFQLVLCLRTLESRKTWHISYTWKTQCTIFLRQLVPQDLTPTVSCDPLIRVYVVDPQKFQWSALSSSLIKNSGAFCIIIKWLELK